MRPLIACNLARLPAAPAPPRPRQPFPLPAPPGDTGCSGAGPAGKRFQALRIGQGEIEQDDVDLVLGKILFRLVHAFDVDQCGSRRGRLVEYLPKQTRISGVVFNQENRLDRGLALSDPLLLRLRQRQLCLRQPEIIDGTPHQALERVELHGLAEVAVRLELASF